jgi:hypothetical protein
MMLRLLQHVKMLVFVGGVRGIKEVARAAVGAGCNHNLPRSGAYMTFAPDFAPNRVTLCK